MQRIFLRGIVVVLLVVFFSTLHFSFKSSSQKNAESTAYILNAVTQSSKAIGYLHEQSTQYKRGQINVKQLKDALISARLDYKKVEFILGYFYPEHVKAFINGAPLLHVNPYPLDSALDKGYYPGGATAYLNSLPLDMLDGGHYLGQPEVVKPEGLQVLDELIFSDHPNADEIETLCKTLDEKFEVLLIAIQKLQHINSFQIIEASRTQLVRIFSLGVTGFDTPGSVNGLEEAMISMQSLQDVLNPIIKNAPIEIKSKINQLFTQAQTYLSEHTDFERFDRLQFLTDFINPLYKELYRAHQSLGLPQSMELDVRENAWNAASTNIFDETFLNPYYYTVLKRTDNSTELKNLGKKLFYDKQLSKSGSLSCASCHKPELAFSDGEAKSKASVEGKTVLRNAPGLINAVFADRFFYDLRAFDLHDQASHVVENHLEFNTSFTEILDKLNKQEEYQELFANIYGGDKAISRHQFAAALTSYVMSLVSFKSPFDQFVRGETDKMPRQVRLGFNLFMGKAACGTCHFAPTFSGLVPPLYHENETEVLGVLTHPDVLEIDGDRGRVLNGVPQENFDIYNRSFKTVTVRNVERTAPYFHNGAYSTLEQVVDFYADGGGSGKGLDYELPNQTLPFDALELNKKEREALIAFMKSLTDDKGIENFYNQAIQEK